MKSLFYNNHTALPPDNAPYRGSSAFSQNQWHAKKKCRSDYTTSVWASVLLIFARSMNNIGPKLLHMCFPAFNVWSYKPILVKYKRNYSNCTLELYFADTTTFSMALLQCQRGFTKTINILVKTKHKNQQPSGESEKEPKH